MLFSLLDWENTSSDDDQDYVGASGGSIHVQYMETVPSAFHGFMGRHIVFLIAKKKSAQQEPQRASRLLGWEITSHPPYSYNTNERGSNNEP